MKVKPLELHLYLGRTFTSSGKSQRVKTQRVHTSKNFAEEECCRRKRIQSEELKKAVAVTEEKIQQRSCRRGQLSSSRFLAGKCPNLGRDSISRCQKIGEEFSSSVKKFAGKPFQQGISDSHSLLELSDSEEFSEDKGYHFLLGFREFLKCKFSSLNFVKEFRRFLG